MKLRWLTTAFAAVLCASVAGAGFAQSTNSGDIRGVVTDTTGAAIPGVTVTVINNNTGVTKALVTNQDGLYDTSSIVVGNYQITFSKDGFNTLKRSSISVEVGVMSVNARLKVGSVTQEVVVNTDQPLLKTENGEQSTTLEAKVMNTLPNVGQDWQNFTILLPGTSGTAMSSQGANNPGQEVAANGNLPYSNVLADGASTTLSHSQNSDVSIFETVQEVQISTSAFSAQYGIGGLILNQISKGGTSQFHGSAYDYWQNSGLNAAPYGFGNKASVSFLRHNDFGGSIGGPILKKKMFFYFNYDQTIEHGAANNGTNTVPSELTKSGDFTGQQLLYDPTTQVMAVDAGGNPYPIRKSFLSEYGRNAIPSSMFDKVAAAALPYFPSPTSHLAGGRFVPGTLDSVGVYENNFYSSLPQSNPLKRYFGRLDYDITSRNRITMSDTQRDVPVVYPNSVTACPLGCQSGDVDSNNAQISDVWTISDHTINEARLGYTYQGNFFADLALNKGLAAKVGWQFAKADDFPSISFSGPYSGLNPSSNAVYKEHVFDPSDVVTMIRGKHILHFGGEFLIYRDDSTAWGNTNAGSMSFTGQYTQQWTVDPTSGLASPNTSTGVDYADFLLGRVQSWSASVSPEYGGRLKSPQVFIQDDYKVLPNLTLNLGLRYQMRLGWKETHNNISTFDPTVPNTASGNLGAMWYASTHANGRHDLQSSAYNTFLPRVGFAWQPYPDTTLRGGFGLYAYNLSLDTYGGGMGGAFSSSGNVTDQTNGITPVVLLGGSGSNLPYVAASTDPTKFNGQNVNYTQYHTPTPQIYQWNLDLQHELGTNMVAEIAYVASHGKNLNFGVDINQIPESKLGPNDVALGYRPFTQYGSIQGSTNNAISNYNSLQASISKRLTSGVSFNFNYTWSHFLDDQDSSGWGGRAGQQNYQNSFDPSANYSNSNFDVRNAFKGSAVYELPFGQGRRYLNNNRLVDEVAGGWQLSGTIVLSSGNPFTVFADGTTYAQAGSQFPNWVPGVSTTPAGGRSIQHWYNPAAFQRPADGTFGNVKRNSLYGPGINEVNLSAGKKFTIRDQVKLQIRADATNAFNHPSFGVPPQGLSVASGAPAGTTSYAGSNTAISWTTVGGRTVQLGAHLKF